MARMPQIARAAVTYWGTVFAFAFAAGIVRTLWLAPAIGALTATLVEVPLVLGVSWWAARRVTTRYRIARSGEAWVMGLAAFALLILAEVTLAGALSGESAGAWLRSLAAPAGAAGLAGQVLFAAMPWWVAGRSR